MADTDAALSAFRIRLDRCPKEALFAAGKAFFAYRRAGGTRGGVLPDFFVGAHAEAQGLALLTRDTRRFATYFPSVRLITP